MKLHKTFCVEDLEKLTDEQLEALLHQELEKDCKDDALILALLRMLEDREGQIQPPDVEAAWQTFEERYHAPVTTEAASKKKTYRWLGTVAAVLAVVLTMTFVAPKVAGEENIFTLIARWTQDLFSFGDPEEEYVFKTDHPGLQAIYNAVVEQGLTDPAVPMWVPEGYELTELKVTPSPDGSYIYAKLISADNYISLTYEPCRESLENMYPKDNEDAEIFDTADTIHYIVHNDGAIIAAWIIDGIECAVVTNQPDILKKVIHSIYAEG